MFDFLKKKKEESFDMGSSDMDGEGKFPPAENAFNDPTPISDSDKSDFPAFPSMPQTSSPPSFGSNLGQRPSTFGARNVPPLEQVQQGQQSSSSSLSGDKMEVIIAKIDGIKSMLEVLNQRIINLETRLTHQETKRW